MKRLISLFLSVLLLATVASAQDAFESTTTWPYIYSDFRQGRIVSLNGEQFEGLLNVHLYQGNIHFIENGVIKEAASLSMASVRIGNDIYVNAGGRMMRVLAKNDNGCVCEDVAIDFVKLNSTGAAYGSSSTSVGTMALSSVEGLGTGTMVNTNHMDLVSRKTEGQTLPLTKKKYIVSNGIASQAVKAEILSLVSDRQDFNTFCKTEKIKWKDNNSLLKVIDYLAR